MLPKNVREHSSLTFREERFIWKIKVGECSRQRIKLKQRLQGHSSKSISHPWYCRPWTRQSPHAFESVCSLPHIPPGIDQWKAAGLWQKASSKVRINEERDSFPPSHQRRKMALAWAKKKLILLKTLKF